MQKCDEYQYPTSSNHVHFFASHVRGRSPKGGWGRGYSYIKSTSVEGKHHLPKSSGIFAFFTITSVSCQGYFKYIFCLFQDGDIKKTAVCTIILLNIIILKKFWVSSFQLRVIPRIFLNRQCGSSRLIFAAPKLSLSTVFHASRLERSMWNTMWWTSPKHQLLFWSS